MAERVMLTTMATGSILRKERERLGLTRARLASLAKLHPNSVKRLEGMTVLSPESWHSIGRVTAVLKGMGADIPDVPGRYRDRHAASILSPAARLLVAPSTRTAQSRLPRAQRPRCEARTRKGTPCQCQALKNGRCRLHGGLSTGPKTPEGRARIAEAQRRRWQERAQALRAC
jgi:hypothetical protein